MNTNIITQLHPKNQPPTSPPLGGIEGGWPWLSGQKVQITLGRPENHDPYDRLIKAIALQAVRDLVDPHDDHLSLFDYNTALLFIADYWQFLVYSCGVPHRKLKFLLHYWSTANPHRLQPAPRTPQPATLQEASHAS